MIKTQALAGLLTLLTISFAQAADLAVCQLFVNDSKVQEEVVLHQDYDVRLAGTYSYRTYKRDEFYDLNFLYTTKSTPDFSKKLELNLVGSENKFLVVVEQTANQSNSALETVIIDHENNKISVKCNIH